ncbi:hypothetical protein L7F22_063031 [Adiantum nelumboides]|nr:hypothetical protein [Adiantum nelumboides]
MNHKRPDPEAKHSSSEEEEDEEEEEEDENESGGESSSEEEEDDFDPDDVRVNMVPGEDTVVTPSQAPVASAQEESSSESDEEEDDTMKVDTEQATNLSDPHSQQKIQTFASDVESEYETDSSSESEGLSQEPTQDVVQGTPIEAMQALPSSQKKIQEARVLESKALTEEGTGKGKNKAAKQREKDPPLSRNPKGEILTKVQKESQSARKGHTGVIRDIASDDSVRDDKKPGAPLKKRKVESSQHDAERDSADSVPITKKKKDADTEHDGKKSAPTDKVLQTPNDTGIDDLSSSKKGMDRDTPSQSLGEIAKEIAKKTLNNINASARANGSKDALESKRSPVQHETMQEKKANSSTVNHRASASKQKKLPHVWSTDEEIILASEVLKRVKMGFEVPSKRADDFWFTLSDILQEKLGIEFSREQLSEKVRRMKQKYQGTVPKIEEARDTKKPFKHKNDSEQRLFDTMSKIWGRAEVTSLEDQLEADNATGKDISKFIQGHDRDAKGKNASSPKAKPSAKANAGKNEAAAMTDKDVDAKVYAVAATSAKPDHEPISKEDQGRNFLPPADSAAFPVNNLDRLIQDRINATLHELQEWSKWNLEEWMNRVYSLVEDSTKRLEDQVRRASWMGMAGVGLPMRLGSGMDFQLVHGDKSYQRQLRELQLHELNVHVQRLELMRKECELKEEQIRAQLQQEQKQK